MADPYTSVTVTDYNLNPPSDDGSEVPSNKGTWLGVKSKLADPVKTAVESINTNVGSAVDKMAGGVTGVSDDYTILSSDQGKLVRETGTGKTITTPDATVVGSPFKCWVANGHASGDLTLDGSGSQTVDGAASITIPAGRGVLLETDGSNWFTSGQNWLDTYYTRRPIAGGYRNLTVQAVSATAVDIDADAVTLENSDGESYRAKSVNLTAAITTSGANGLDTGAEAGDTWYAVWVIYNPTTDTVAGLLSISATAPTLPSGYTFKARVGWVRNDGSSNFYRTLQKGNRAQIIVGTNPTTTLTIISGSSGSPTTPTWTAVAIGAFVPSTASAIILYIQITNAVIAIVAPNNSYGAYNSATTPPPIIRRRASGDEDAALPTELMLESTNIYYASNASASSVELLGWVDNL